MCDFLYVILQYYHVIIVIIYLVRVTLGLACIRGVFSWRLYVIESHRVSTLAYFEKWGMTASFFGFSSEDHIRLTVYFTRSVESKSLSCPSGMDRSSACLYYFLKVSTSLDIVWTGWKAVCEFVFSECHKTPFKVFVNLQWIGKDSEILWIWSLRPKLLRSSKPVGCNHALN